MPMILLDGFPTQVDDRKLAEITQAVLETISKRVEDVDVWLPELKLAVFTGWRNRDGSPRDVGLTRDDGSGSPASSSGRTRRTLRFAGVAGRGVGPV